MFIVFFDQFSNGDFVIRIDDHFNYDLIADLFHHNLQCCLNASTITTEILDTLYNQKSLSKVYFCHNYYPRPDTGLALNLLNNEITSLENMMNMPQLWLLFLELH